MKPSPKSRRNVLISYVFSREIRGQSHYVYAIEMLFFSWKHEQRPQFAYIKLFWNFCKNVDLGVFSLYTLK